MTFEEHHPMRGETFQGNPCRRGHPGKRYRKGGTCVECQRLADTARRQRLKSHIPQPVG